MKRITIRAAAGRTVRDPVSLALLSAEWVTKENSAYWQKRIAQGDVEVKTETIPAPSFQRIKEAHPEKTKYSEEVKKDD